MEFYEKRLKECIEMLDSCHMAYSDDIIAHCMGRASDFGEGDIKENTKIYNEKIEGILAAKKILEKLM